MFCIRRARSNTLVPAKPAIADARGENPRKDSQPCLPRRWQRPRPQNRGCVVNVATARRRRLFPMFPQSRYRYLKEQSQELATEESCQTAPAPHLRQDTTLPLIARFCDTVAEYRQPNFVVRREHQSLPDLL